MIKKTTKIKAKKTQVFGADWELAGEVGVDSGQLMVCDPCYVDSEWQSGTRPAGHPPLVLSQKGRDKFPALKNFRCQWPHFNWGDGTYDDICPELGMSINEANKLGLLEEVDLDPERDFSYRGACDVSHLKGDGFGQMNYKAGHAGVGVAFTSGYGDGRYRVYVRRNSDGRIVEARIVMAEGE